MNRTWTEKEEKYLLKYWSWLTRQEIARKLNKDLQTVSRKAHQMGLGKSWEGDECLSLSRIFRAMFGYKPCIRVIRSKLISRGCPYETKRVGNRTIQYANLSQFWRWLKEHKDEYSFLGFEKYALGYEPSWVDIKRKAEWAEHNKKRWG